VLKLSHFAAEGDVGRTVYPLFGPAEAEFEKLAAPSLLPAVVEYIAQLRPRADAQYVLVNAMGAGEFYGCFPAGTLVDTAEGEQPIELVAVGTSVPTHRNRYRKVTAVASRQTDELCDLYVQGLPSTLPSLTATPNHELYAVTRDDFLRVKRRVVWAGDTRQSVERRRLSATAELEFSWVAIAELQPGDLVAEPVPQEEDPAALGDLRWSTPEVAFLMGLYAAEGCVAYRYDREEDDEACRIVYVTNELEQATHVEATRCASVLGHKLARQTGRADHSCRLELCDKALTLLCLKHIGSPAVDKKLSPAVLRMPRAWQKMFFAAYSAGDGCVRGEGKEEGAVRCVSASAALLRGMRLLLARQGYAASISGRYNRKATWYSGKPIFELSISGGQLRGRGTPKSYLHPGGYILSAVKRVHLYEWSGYVHDLTVEEDSSYTASGLTVHNSNVNGDHFPELGLIHKPEGWSGNPLIDRVLARTWSYGFPTFYNAHPFAHHRNKDASRAFGEIELAVWNELMKRVELVMRIDYQRCQRFGGQPVWDRLKAGGYPDVSMGTRVPWDRCSICTDLEEYERALRSFDPRRHAHPGLAVLEWHKRHPIRGISVTRNDYCEHARSMMNRILPDGRKVFVYNDYPRFFDISVVFIGADKTAKAMLYIYRPGADQGWVKSSAELAEELGVVDEPVKLASVQDELFKLALLGKRARVVKKGEIKKDHVPSQFTPAAVSLLTDREPGMPDHLLDALSAIDSRRALSTASSMGLLLKPEEFQRVLLTRLGHRRLAQQLEHERVLFPQSNERTPIGMSAQMFNPALARLLEPIMRDRSALGPHVEQRVVMIIAQPVQEKRARTSLSSDLLRKLGAAYNGYRSEVMDVLHQVEQQMGADSELEKFAYVREDEQLLTPLSVKYVEQAYLTSPLGFSAPEVVLLPKEQDAGV
jgi:hypothetical protein